MKTQPKFVAYEATENEYALFDSHEAATAWLLASDGYDGISEETENGDSYIAQITHRTRLEVTDRKENYHEHGDDCDLQECDLQEWPYEDKFNYVGKVKFRDVRD